MNLSKERSQSHNEQIMTLVDRQKTYNRGRTNIKNNMTLTLDKQRNICDNFNDKNLSSQQKNNEQNQMIEQRKVKRSIQKNKNEIMNQLLQLQQRWINKQTQIHSYIQTLHKKIKQKDFKILIIEKENYLLKQRLQRTQKQQSIYAKDKKILKEQNYEVGQLCNQQEKKKRIEYKNQRMEGLSIHNDSIYNKDEKQKHKTQYDIQTQVEQKQQQKQHKLIYQKQLINYKYSPKNPITMQAPIKKQKQLRISSDQIHSTYYTQQQKHKQIQENINKYSNQLKKSSKQLQIKKNQKVETLKNQNFQVQKNLFDYNLKQNNISLNKQQEKQQDTKNKQKINDIIPSQKSSQQRVIQSQKQIDEEDLQRRVMSNIRKILQQNNIINHNNKKNYDIAKQSLIIHQTISNKKQTSQFPIKNIYEKTNIINTNIHKNTSNNLNEEKNIYHNKNDQYFKEQSTKNIYKTINQSISPLLQESSIYEQPLLNETKEKEIRLTSTTDQTYETNLVKEPSQKGSIIMVKKNSNKVFYQTNYNNENSEEKYEYQKPLQISYNKTYKNNEVNRRQKQVRHNHKSSKTITFSNQPQIQYGLMKQFQQNEFHSQNKINIPHNINVDSVNVSPYQSVQGTPQGSMKLIKAQSYQQQAQSQGVSQVETVKRNPMSKKEDRHTENIRNQDRREKVNLANNIVPNSKSNNKLLTEKVYDQLIVNISGNNRKNLSRHEQMIVDKKSSVNSEDDPLSQLISQQTSSRKNIIPLKEEQQIQQTNDNMNDRHLRSVQRKKSRMNTKLTYLDYSLTESNVSLSQIDGSLFRQRQTNHKKSLVYESYRGIGVIVPIQQERNQRQSFKTQCQDYSVQVEQFGDNQNNEQDIGIMTQSINHQEQQKAIQTVLQQQQTMKIKQQQQNKKMQQQQSRKKQNRIEQMNNLGPQVVNGTKQPLKTALKYNVKARLLLQQNSQTQSKHYPISSQIINNQPNINDLSKKLSFSSSAGSKFYYPLEEQYKQQQQKQKQKYIQKNKYKQIQQKQQKQKYQQAQKNKQTKGKQNQLLFNPTVYQCNIKNKSTIQQYNTQIKHKHTKPTIIEPKLQQYTKNYYQNDSTSKKDHIIELQKQPSNKLSKNISQKSIPYNKSSNSQLQQQNNKISNLQQQFYYSAQVGIKPVKSKNFTSPSNHSNISSNFSYHQNIPSSKRTTNSKFINQKTQKSGSQHNNFKGQQKQKYFKKPTIQKENSYIPSSKTNSKKSQSFFIHQQQDTLMKQPEFDEQQYECYTASQNKQNKSLPFQQDSRFSYQDRSQSFTKQRHVPHTKSTAFKQKTQTNNYYLQKSPSQQSQQQQISNHAFKKMYKFTTESSQQSQYERQSYHQQPQKVQFLIKQKQRQFQSLHSNTSQTTNSQIDVDRILFQNSMLKSYNKTLQNKIKKSGKMEKLMQKFNSQNVSIRNKIHKKSNS